MTGESKSKSDERQGQSRLLLIVGSILLAAVVLLVVFIPCPSSTQYGVFKVLIALASAGVGALIPGFIKVQFKSLVSAGGALAIFVLVFMVDPASKLSKDKCNEPFEVMVNLKLPSNNPELKPLGNLTIAINEETRTEPITDKLSASFRNIPFEYRDKPFVVSMNIAGWSFQDKSNSAEVSLHGKTWVDLQIIPDDILCCIQGTVMDEDGSPVPNAKVMLGDMMVETSQTGWFEMSIPPKKQKRRQNVTITCEGFENWSGVIAPELKENSQIQLLKRSE